MTDYDKFRAELVKFEPNAQRFLSLHDAPSKGSPEFFFAEDVAYLDAITPILGFGSAFESWAAPDPSLSVRASYARKRVSGAFIDFVSEVTSLDASKDSLNRAFTEAKSALRSFVGEINSFLAEASPVRGSYRGISVSNPERVPENGYLRLLSSIDRIFDEFKKRGLADLVLSTIRRVEIRKAASGETSSAYYDSTRETVILLTKILFESPRLLDNWIHEVFIHEVGHHVHLNLLHPRAKHEWDSGWAEVESAKRELQKNIAVTHDDRVRFFDLIRRSGWDPNKAGARLKGVERMKYLSWLHNTAGNRVSSSPNQVRLTDYGKTVFRFFANPEERLREYEESNPPDRAKALLERVDRAYRSNLFLTESNRSTDYPLISPEAQEEIRRKDRTVDEALNRLGIPTDYGRTNELEDFAETFVLFVTNPQRLSPMARYRMSRALSLSGFYGKPILPKLAARRVALRYLSR